MELDRIETAVLNLDTWLDSMRGPDGYGGPVTHWWQDSLVFTGVGLDWRYEGIIIGYLNLYERTHDDQWLGKAKRAGDDLVKGQLPTGNFRNSSFETNPHTSGTPHEAACDLALLRLAKVLQRITDPIWQYYAQAAERNLEKFILGALWDRNLGYFRNEVEDRIFVPNKAATIVEALFAWMDVTGKEEILDKYILPTLDRILSCQMHSPNKKVNGAIDQSRGERKREGWFFPFYNARCIPALLLGYQVTNHDHYLNGAIAVFDFILHVQVDDGSFPQVMHTNGRTNRFPRWIAGVGDILRAMSCLEGYHPQINNITTLKWMLDGLLPSGGIRTADGFARRGRWPSRRYLPDFRDILPVVGWVDKAFRFLTTLITPNIRSDMIALEALEQPCLYYGRKCTYYEDSHSIEIHNKNRVYYRWQKGTDWAEVS